MIITVDVLKAIAPGCRAKNIRRLGAIADSMNHWFPGFKIDSVGELRHFIAQAAQETDSFNALEEYATGDDYDTRTDLGNTPQRDGDGRRLKGRGVFMTTGAKNYKQATLEWNDNFPEDKKDFFESPELLSEPLYAVWSACQYWNQRGLDVFANMKDQDRIWVNKLNKYLVPVEYITWRINGGFNGLGERKIFYERAKNIIK
jgi:putative chitinase